MSTLMENGHGCWENQGDANLQVDLQKYFIPTAFCSKEWTWLWMVISHNMTSDI